MRRELATSNFSSFLFSLLIFLLISEIQARRLQQEECSSSCGDIKNISYPFRLKDDPAGCGDHNYELSCQSNKTILEFHPGKYLVKRISYAEQKITLVDFNLANGSCSLPQKSPSETEIYDDKRYYIGLRIPVYANFVRCSSKISDPTCRRLPCLDGNQSYVYVKYGGYYIDDLPMSCSFISRVAMREASMEYPPYEAIQKLLQSGFDLRWFPECRDCGSAYEVFQKFLQSGFDTSWFLECRDCGSAYENLVFVMEILWPILVVLASFLLHIISSLREFLFLLSSLYLWLLEEQQFPIPQLGQSLRHLWQFRISTLVDYISYNYLNLYLPPYLIEVISLELEAIIIARFILVMVFVVFTIHRYIKTRKKVDNVEKFLHKQQSWVPKRYSYIEIIAITNHFRDKLGQGGFGSVYKGQLLNGSFIAVKVLENSKFSGEEFISEVSTIGRIHHTNVVRLLGFCSEGSKRALVYEYMPNGSLDRHIFSKKENGQAFSWEKLHEIALGTARGIDYLHNGCDVCILHFDIKPHNILLDCNFNPKVADFGLAKFYPKENDFICVSATRGTVGYIAPELISRTFGVVSSKSDVYSFGMLLLEISGGRRNSFAKATRSSKAYFPSWVYDRIIEGRDLEIQNVSEIEALIARKLCIIGLWCIQVKATDRPSIAKVVEMLEGSIDDLQMPPKPFFSSSPPRCNSIKEIQTDSSTELLEYSDSIEECSFIDHINVA
ncbi:hypothetical protein ACOSQ4_019959 [Xanthoceras sorbifolium]